jgi:hypothetical protein
MRFTPVTRLGFLVLAGAALAAGFPRLSAVESQASQPLKVLDGSPRLIVVNGYSTSFQWPDVLQRKLNKLFDGKSPVKVEKATVAGSPIAKWMNVKTGEPLSPWTKVLRPKLKGDGKTPVIVLCQQSLQGVYGNFKDGIRGPDDTERIKQGADALEKYARLLQKDGASLVFIAMHIYKKPSEPAIGNERLALKEFMKRKPVNVVEGPDVWTPTKEVYPFGFAPDGMHPSGCGVEVMAQYWFEALCKYDGRETPAWSKEEMEKAIKEDKARRGK